MDILQQISPMLYGNGLTNAMSVYPRYDARIKHLDPADRLLALADLYQLYIPSAMSREIYCKLYTGLLQSLRRKDDSRTVTIQSNINYKTIRGSRQAGVMGGVDSFSIIGPSGIGKSSAVRRALSLICPDTLTTRHARIVPYVLVECPFDCSVKGLLLEILSVVDRLLQTNYYNAAIRSRATTDMLIGSVSQVALNHIGMLIVDEIQHITRSRGGANIVGALTQLINSSGISICMIGMPESDIYIEAEMQLARRCLGLRYGPLSFDGFFEIFCKELWQYQYVAAAPVYTPAVAEWLYEHSGGLLSVVVSLVHDAQEIAIMSGRERMDIEALTEAYRTRLTTLHTYIDPPRKSHYPNHPQVRISIPPAKEDVIDVGPCVQGLIIRAKTEDIDVVTLMEKNFVVEEVLI